MDKNLRNTLKEIGILNWEILRYVYFGSGNTEKLKININILKSKLILELEKLDVLRRIMEEK